MSTAFGIKESNFQWRLGKEIDLQWDEQFIHRPEHNDKGRRLIFWLMPYDELGFEMPDYGNEIPDEHTNIHDYDEVWENVPLSELGDTVKKIHQARKEYDEANPPTIRERDFDDERKYGSPYDLWDRDK